MLFTPANGKSQRLKKMSVDVSKRPAQAAEFLRVPEEALPSDLLQRLLGRYGAL